MRVYSQASPGQLVETDFDAWLRQALAWLVYWAYMHGHGPVDGDDRHAVYQYATSMYWPVR